MKKLSCMAIGILSLNMVGCNDDDDFVASPVPLETSWAYYEPTFAIDASKGNLLSKEVWYQKDNQLYFDYGYGDETLEPDSAPPIVGYLSTDGLYVPSDVKGPYGYEDSTFIYQNDEKWVTAPVGHHGLGKLQFTKEFKKIDLSGKALTWAVRASFHALKSDPEIFEKLDDLAQSDVKKAQIQYYFDTLGDAIFPQGSYCLMETKTFANQDAIDFWPTYPNESQSSIDQYHQDYTFDVLRLGGQIEHYVEKNDHVTSALFSLVKYNQQWFSGLFYPKNYGFDVKEVIEDSEKEIAKLKEKYGENHPEVRYEELIMSRGNNHCSYFNSIASQVIDQAQKLK